MSKENRKKNEEFDTFLEKEILTANRYDDGSEEKEGTRYEDAGIDARILRAVRELGFEHMTPIQEQSIPLFMTGGILSVRPRRAPGRRRPSAFRFYRRSTRKTALCRR